MRGKLFDRQATTRPSIFQSKKKKKKERKKEEKKLHGPLVKARDGVTSTISSRRRQSRRIFTPSIGTHPLSIVCLLPIPFPHTLHRLHSICQVIFQRRLYLTGHTFTRTTIFHRRGATRIACIHP